MNLTDKDKVLVWVGTIMPSDCYLRTQVIKVETIKMEQEKQDLPKRNLTKYQKQIGLQKQLKM